MDIITEINVLIEELEGFMLQNFRPVKIRHLSLQWLDAHERFKDFETQNHPHSEISDFEESVENYWETLSQFDFSSFAHVIPDANRKEVGLCRFTQAALAKGADDILKFRDVSVETWTKLQPVIEILETLMSNPPYFIRLDGCSPKDSPLSFGPHVLPQSILKALMTSPRCLKNMRNQNGKFVKLFLNSWKSVDATDEFRCFICDGSLTAISVYSYADERTIKWSSKSIQDLTQVAFNIQGKWDEVSSKLPWSSAVMDVYADFQSLEVSIVEFNPFGAQLGTGSSLFHWVKDYQYLYGLSGTMIVFAFITR